MFQPIDLNSLTPIALLKLAEMPISASLDASIAEVASDLAIERGMDLFKRAGFKQTLEYIRVATQLQNKLFCDYRSSVVGVPLAFAIPSTWRNALSRRGLCHWSPMAPRIPGVKTMLQIDARIYIRAVVMAETLITPIS
jgi:hypothetical protein